MSVEEVLILTIVGDTIVSVNDPTYKQIIHNTMIGIDPSETKDTDKVLYDRAYLKATLGVMDKAYMGDSRYSKAKHIFFREKKIDKKHSFFVPQLKCNLVEGIHQLLNSDFDFKDFYSDLGKYYLGTSNLKTRLSKGADQLKNRSEESLEDALFACENEMDFSHQERSFLFHYTHWVIKKSHEQNKTPKREIETIKRWFWNYLIEVNKNKGAIMSPGIMDWCLFKVLSRINPKFMDFYSDYEEREKCDVANPFDNSYMNYLFYVKNRVRMGKFSISKSKGSSISTESNPSLIDPFERLLGTHFIEIVDDDYITARVLGVITDPEVIEARRNEPNIYEGVVTAKAKELPIKREDIRYYGDYLIIKGALAKIIENYLRFHKDYGNGLNTDIYSKLGGRLAYVSKNYFSILNGYMDPIDSVQLESDLGINKEMYVRIRKEVMSDMEMGLVDNALKLKNGYCVNVARALFNISTSAPPALNEYLRLMGVDYDEMKGSKKLRKEVIKKEASLLRRNYSISEDLPISEEYDGSFVSSDPKTGALITIKPEDKFPDDPLVKISEGQKNKDYYPLSRINETLNRYGLMSLKPFLVSVEQLINAPDSSSSFLQRNPFH